MTATVLLEARGLAIRFGGVVAADGVDLDVLEGEKLAIIGPNGAGKTTFLNIATGYLKPQAGTVRYCMLVAPSILGEIRRHFPAVFRA